MLGLEVLGILYPFDEGSLAWNKVFHEWGEISRLTAMENNCRSRYGNKGKGAEMRQKSGCVLRNIWGFKMGKLDFV